MRSPAQLLRDAERLAAAAESTRQLIATSGATPEDTMRLALIEAALSAAYASMACAPRRARRRPPLHLPNRRDAWLTGDDNKENDK